MNIRGGNPMRVILMLVFAAVSTEIRAAGPGPNATPPAGLINSIQNTAFQFGPTSSILWTKATTLAEARTVMGDPGIAQGLAATTEVWLAGLQGAYNMSQRTLVPTGVVYPFGIIALTRQEPPQYIAFKGQKEAPPRP